MEPDRALLHATAIAVRGCAVLIRGPSGAGKSDLALRCLASSIHHGGTDIAADLVADDQVIAERRGAVVLLSAPATIRDRIEIRGLGIWSWPALVSARLVAAVDLVTPSDVERLPTLDAAEILGVSVPRLKLAPFELSAPAKLLLWLAALASNQTDEG